jgi:hypothetical protein
VVAGVAGRTALRSPLFRCGGRNRWGEPFIALSRYDLSRVATSLAVSVETVTKKPASRAGFYLPIYCFYKKIMVAMGALEKQL